MALAEVFDAIGRVATIPTGRLVIEVDRIRLAVRLAFDYEFAGWFWELSSSLTQRSSSMVPTC